MIDIKNKILFIHIPKTAGTSIENYFQEIRGISNKESGALGLFLNPKDSKLERQNGHNTLDMYENYFFGGEVPADYKLFTVVRHPIARFWSEHSYRRIPSPDRFPLTFQPSANQLIKLTENPIQMLKDLNAHMKPQSVFIRGHSNQRVRILHQENLASEFAELCNEWNLPAKELPRANISRRRRRPKDQSKIDRWIRDFYRSDFETFGYE